MIFDLSDIQFADKGWLLLLLLIIPYIIWYVMFSKSSEPAIRMADTFSFSKSDRSWRQRLLPLLPFLRIVAFTMLVLALARPQTHNAEKKEYVEGIDIMMTMDVSTSMLYEDMRDDSKDVRNRIEAAKYVAAEFISNRPSDNIGLVIFAGEAFTRCPMTVDHGSLLSLLHDVPTNITARGFMQDGTAIGLGLATAVSRLKESKAKTKVVILLTDGTNNCGDISPQTAADIANMYRIRVYTIGVGSDGMALLPVTQGNRTRYVQVPVEKIDTKTLEEIATKTGGDFYTATNTEELSRIYKEIDKLEKSKLEVKSFKRKYEAYQQFIFGAAIVLLLEILLRLTVFRRIP